MPCPECPSGVVALKRACQDVPCTDSEAAFYPMILLPLVVHIAIVYFVAYKLETYYKKESMPFWKVYLLVIVVMGVYFIISFAVFFARDQTFDPFVRCTNNFALMFSIVAILYVIAFSFALPVVIQGRQPPESDYNESKYFAGLIAGLSVFLLASRFIIFA